MKPIFIIADHKKEDKTKFLQELTTLMHQEGFRILGFLTIHNKENESYLIRNLQSNEEKLLMIQKRHPHQKQEYFQFMEEGIRAGQEWLTTSGPTGPFITVIDEIGYYELEDKVWGDTLTSQMRLDEPFLFTTTLKLLPAIIKKWKIHPAAVFYPQDFDKPYKISKQIIDTINMYQKNSF